MCQEVSRECGSSTDGLNEFETNPQRVHLFGPRPALSSVTYKRQSQECVGASDPQPRVVDSLGAPVTVNLHITGKAPMKV